MATLSNIFGGDDSDSASSSDNSLGTDTVGDLTSTLGLDASSSSDSYSQDEDGNIDASSSDQSLSLDTSTDGLLGNVTDAFSSSDDVQDS